MAIKLIFILIFIFFVSFTSVLASASVKINEIMPKTPKATYTENCEWIELYADSAVELTNWKIDAGGKGQVFVFNYSLKDFLILTKNKQAFLKNWQIQEEKVIEAKNIALNDNGDTVKLSDEGGNNIDGFEYTASHEDKSWQLSETEEWQECEETPGEENFCEIEQEQEGIEKNKEETEKQETAETPEETEESNEKEEEEADNEKTSKIIGQAIKETKKSIGGEDEESENKKISLNAEPKDIKNTKTALYVSKSEKIKMYAIYGFTLLCLLIALSFLLLKGKKRIKEES